MHCRIELGSACGRKKWLQLARHFAPELATFGQEADAVLAAADALTQIETIDWFLVDGGYTLEQTREAMVTGLRRLLGPPAATAEGGR